MNKRNLYIVIVLVLVAVAAGVAVFFGSNTTQPAPFSGHAKEY